MASEWWKPLATLCFVSVLLGPGIGERFYQDRDHRDQNMYEKKLDAVTVHNKREAEQQLEKYGYLHCRIHKRHKRSFLPTFMLEETSSNTKTSNFIPSEGYLPPCSNREVRNAIRQYQKTYKLPETGKLDKQTKRFMSASRCGNSDKEDAALKSAKEAERTRSAEVTNTINTNNDPSTWGSKFKSRPWKRSTSYTNSLMKVISGRDPTSSLERRSRYLNDYIEKLKNEDPMMYKADSKEKIIHIRKRRSIEVTEQRTNRTQTALQRVRSGQRFEKPVIRWRLLESGYSARIPADDQRGTIDLAFRMWAEVIPLQFIEETSGDIANVDIEVAFGTGAHQNCKRDFDGRGGEIAHSFSTGNMHFDDDEHFKSLRSMTPEGIFLLRVAVHEIGHVLGLPHTDKKYSIMYAIYEKENSGPDFELGWEDRKDVQRVYGVCKGRFNTVFDWVRKLDNGKFIFNTYFFRGHHYWMYENHANRTRYGDPLYIAREWSGIPNEPDGYAHVWYYTANENVYDAFFFKGEYVYKYNNEKDELFEGWPQKISDVYGPKPGTDGESVPNNLDTVFFDMRDKNIYFFKDDLVYVYDPKEPKDSLGCCVRVTNLTDEFPPAVGHRPLPANIDAVYYSYIDQALYFIQGEDVWQNVLFHPRQKSVKNSVKYLGKWWDKWFDICDVTTHSTYLKDSQNVT